jgi:hypothetical protein
MRRKITQRHIRAIVNSRSCIKQAFVAAEAATANRFGLIIIIVASTPIGKDYRSNNIGDSSVDNSSADNSPRSINYCESASIINVNYVSHGAWMQERQQLSMRNARMQ